MKAYCNKSGKFVFIIPEKVCVFDTDSVKSLLHHGGIVFGAGNEFLQVHPLGAQIMLVIPGQETFYALPKGAVQQMLWQPDKEYPLDQRRGLCYLCSRLKKADCPSTGRYVWFCERNGEVVGGKMLQAFVPPRKCCM